MAVLLYLLGFLISVEILYLIIKAGVRDGILQAHAKIKNKENEN